MTYKVYYACDPGCSKSGLAAVTAGGSVLYAVPVGATSKTLMIKKLRLEMRLMANQVLESGGILHRYVVEEQLYYGQKRTRSVKGVRAQSSPANLIALAKVAGAAFSILEHEGSKGRFVEPMTWKGSVPKDVCHRNLCHALGWQWEQQDLKAGTRIVPRNMQLMYNDVPTDAQWPDVLDAIGLARWAASQENTP